MAESPERDAWVTKVLGVKLGGTDPGIGKLVAYRQALLEFEAARKTVDDQIAALRDAVISKLPAEAETADELSDHLGDLNENVGDLVDAAMNAADEERAEANAKAAAALEAYVNEVSDNPLVKHADGNPFVPVTIAATLGGAAKKVTAALV